MKKEPTAYGARRSENPVLPIMTCPRCRHAIPAALTAIIDMML